MGIATSVIQKRRQQVARYDAAEWTKYDPVLLEGEIGFEIDTNKLKVGNGINSWSNLSYIAGVGGGGGATNTVTSYRSSYESDGYVYSGMLLNSSPYILRTINNTTEVATGLTDLETDWTNRLSLTYI